MTTNIIVSAPEIRITFQPKMKMAERPVVTNADQGVALIRQHWDENFYELREESRLMLLTNTCRVLGIFTLSIGGTSQTVVDPAIIFLISLRTPGTKKIILAHNHPNGSLHPSLPDRQLTNCVQAGATLLGLQLMDHYIITSDSHLSMADEGLL